MKNISFIKIVFVLFCLIYGVSGQSTKIDFPTPVTRDEVKGKIPARDIGDSRLTTHYYIFEGKQGDIFINIEANNLNGDIDIFLAENLKPLTKINLYADSGATQTGRELYLRKAEKLILRVEGRTPNDDAATYSIKFSGSFQAVSVKSVPTEPKTPEIKEETDGEVKVNSVGTIIKTSPKPPTTAIKATAKIKTGKEGNNAKVTEVPVAVSTIKPKNTPKIQKEKVVETTEKKVEVVVTDELPKPTEAEVKTPENKEETPKPKTVKTKTTTKKGTAAAKTANTTTAKAKNTQNEELTKALENIRLVVEFKDGGKIERPMNKILRFGVDKGVLTIVHQDGSIGKYSILEITKISVE